MKHIGIDIGGTKIETAIFDRDFNAIQSWRIPTPKRDYASFLMAVRDQVVRADELIGEHSHVGIGMPGLINSQGRVLSANVPCATGQCIAADLKRKLNRKVALMNDTRCFALSEANRGAGDGFHRVFGAIIGTGAAGGLCVGKEIQQTQLGIAGEYGHLPLSAQLQQKYALPVLTCGCGLVGCTESYIAGPGIEFLYQHFTGQRHSSSHWASQLDANDPQAQTILQCYLDILGETFASLCKLVEPDIIVLGGGVSQVAQIAEHLSANIEKYLFKGFSAPPVVNARFGDASGVRGAAMLGGD
ncbi:ROK family protein [Lacimicrobium alkaliphilum]|uniref:Transcriptional regulator n=1 Tax=Lacimicrobium alkaliphilum TaxID=1526571 RepID=A0ABQ1RKS0_9ALTE|nr:ROK family protein [Lacimicrobium alkaliphilum]GGD69694.1 transcriptional regulator [Lacimicrobium alkaliphilum]